MVRWQRRRRRKCGWRAMGPDCSVGWTRFDQILLPGDANHEASGETFARDGSRKRTGASAMEQRMITEAIKRSRYLGMLPYVGGGAM